MKHLVVSLLLLLSLLSLTQAAVKTVLEFKRPLDTCDPNGDLVIGKSGTARVVYAFGDTDPISPTNAAQHIVRGARSVNLASAPRPAEPTESDLRNKDINFNKITTSPAVTYYHCQGFNISNENHLHVVKFEPIIDPTHPDNVHHILIYECDNLNAADLAYSGDCESPSVPTNLRNCNFQKLIAAWAVGGTPFIYPPNVGYSIGGTYSKYLLMEIHFNNPSATSLTDSSGMRLYVTQQLRPIEAGVMMTGMPVNPNVLSIPAGQTAYYTYGGCPTGCTGPTIPQSGITVFSTFLHGHLAARGVDVYRLAPNGTQLPSIDENPSYDFDFQDVHNLPNPIKVYPGENIVVRCTYNTVGRTRTTYAGLGTSDEMCLAFLFYYPKVPQLSKCLSAPLSSTVLYAECAALGAVINATVPVVTTPLPPPPACTAPPTSTTGTVVTRKGTVDLSAFPNSQYMDTNNKYKLYWFYNQTAAFPYIHFALEVETSGWVGIGISPNGDMTGSDIFFGWVDANGNVFAQDRKAVAHALPNIDSSQDIYDVVGSEQTITGSGTSGASVTSTGQVISTFILLGLGLLFLLF